MENLNNLTREELLVLLKNEVEHGFERAFAQKSISTSVIFDKVLEINKMLCDGLEDYDPNDYAMYGLPLFKATALKYGWENPIGDDTGREEYYNETPSQDYGFFHSC